MSTRNLKLNKILRKSALAVHEIEIILLESLADIKIKPKMSKSILALSVPVIEQQVQVALLSGLLHEPMLPK